MSKKFWYQRTALCALFCMLSCIAWAQAVIFPQQKQPGNAVASEENGEYTIGNELFKAKFCITDGDLFFNGSEELGLLPGGEIFKVQLKDGTEIPASAFNMTSITTETLSGNAAAVKGSRRFCGVQIKAEFKHDNGLGIEWRAVLRDGSHYLRTEVDITNTNATDGIEMYSITPMMYTVKNEPGIKAPAVVGNTRGAVIASDNIFAGLESPMGIQTAGETTDLESFAFKAWTGKSSFAWIPKAEDIPQVIKDLSQYGPDKVVGTRGYLVFRQEGEQTITLDYTGGNNDGNKKLHILGVDIVDFNGTVKSGDYHYGTTGGSDAENVYTIDVPSATAYMVRIFISENEETVASKGNILYSEKVALPALVYDLASTQEPYWRSSTGEDSRGPNIPLARQNAATRALSGNTIASQGTITDSWETSSWTAAQNIPQAITDMGYASNQVVSIEQELTMQATGKLDVTFTWTGGSHRLDLVGVDLTDADGNVVWGDYNRQAINSDAPAKYTVAAVAGTYTLRYFVETKTESVNSNGTISLTHSTIPSLDETSKTGSYQWDTRNNDWSAFTDWNGNLPSGVTTTGTAKYIDQIYTIGIGYLTTEFDYSETIGASHKINTLGVQVLDYAGNVVPEDFHNGASGTDTKATYKVIVPKEGIYTVRSIVARTNDYNTAGDTNFSFESIKSITGEAPTTAEWTTEGSTEVASGDIPSAIKELKNESGTAITQVKVYTSECFHIKAGKLSGLYSWKTNSGNQRVNIVGIEAVNLNNVVVSADYHWGWAGSQFFNNTYSLNLLEDGIYYLRYYAETNTNALDSDIDITYTLTEIESLGSISEGGSIADTWTADKWKTIAAAEVPNRVNEVGCTDENARVIEQTITLESAGRLSVEFLFDNNSGTHRLNMVGVDLVDASGNVVVDDYHAGHTGSDKENNIYKFDVFAPGTYVIRYFANNAESINSTGKININLNVEYTLHLIAAETTPITGMWRRQTTLKAGETWNISAVVGLIAPGQARRSFLCYSERERAVPWRAVPAYISWYEINIDRNNAPTGQEHTNATEADCLPILEAWKTQLYDKYGEAPCAFVWDDGWDAYGEWKFHSGFPNGFKDMDAIGRQMGAGQGAWLGPVGGYGTSGDYRRAYWSGKGGMQLSNPLYYDVFVNAVTNLLETQGYDFRFFKFDGISQQFSSVGPDPGATGEENAEAIIMAEKILRSIKEDVFLNTSVGTWASPFWFQFTDAIWRQEKDYGEIGNNSNDRENWITYRDRLVYQNYVQNSPLCPINTLMTHGFIFTNFSEPASTSREWKTVVNELRCAFACGSGMVELYNDFELTNNLVNPATGNAGELWGEIAKCMKWQRDNADVLPDIHWVGGNPWTGSKAEVYGWAAWNAQKAVLTLRNGAPEAQEYTFTLREALDIPEYVNTSITLTKAFTDEADLAGLPTGAIDIDTELTVTLPGSSVYVFDGVDNNPQISISTVVSEQGIATFYANEAVNIPNNVEAYVAIKKPVLTGEGEDAEGTISLQKIENGIIPAKTGVVLLAEEGTYTFTGAEDDGTPVEGNMLKGYAGGAQYENVAIPADGATNYVLTVENDIAGFYKKDSGFKVYNHKAYLQVPAELQEVRKLNILFGDADNATGISNLLDMSHGSSTHVFDLQGRQVKSATHGVYIVNGKKLIK